MARDGSGSSSGSRTETVKATSCMGFDLGQASCALIITESCDGAFQAYKESTQDESSSSASRSEQAQAAKPDRVGLEMFSRDTNEVVPWSLGTLHMSCAEKQVFRKEFVTGCARWRSPEAAELFENRVVL